MHLEIGCVTAEKMRQEDVGKYLLSSTRQLLWLAIENLGHHWVTISLLCTNGVIKCFSCFVRATNFGTVGSFSMWTSACWSRALTIANEWEDLLRYGYLPWSIFPLLLGAITGNLSQSFFDTFSVGS